jgi:putative transposase
MEVSNPNVIHYKRRLPHAYTQNNPVFITWRLKFTLPNHLIQSLKEQKDAFEKEIETLSEDYQNMQRYQFSKKQFNWLDELLTQDIDFPQLLQRPDVAEIIQNALHYLDDKKYCLHAYCVMPNHVHVLLTPYCEKADEKSALSDITHSLKRYTAREINKLLEKAGAMWARESYDHIVRNETEFGIIIEYIIGNPVKAKLVEHWKAWQYTWIDTGLSEGMSKNS